jgi:hypothetical protein
VAARTPGHPGRRRDELKVIAIDGVTLEVERSKAPPDHRNAALPDAPRGRAILKPW